MGGHRCVILGCTSGYNKDGKVHSFLVPKNNVELWQRALLQYDTTIKPGQAVCARHFLEEDVLWRKVLKGPDGKVLGVSADYKVPRLRKGAVPSQFLGSLIEVEDVKFPLEYTPCEDLKGFKVKTEDTDEKITCKDFEVKTENTNENITCKDFEVKSENINENVSSNTLMDNIKTETCKTESYIYIEHAYNIPYTNVKHEIENVKEVLPLCKIVCNSEKTKPGFSKGPSLFDEIYRSEDSIVIPPDWCRQNITFVRALHFCRWIGRKESNTPNSIKVICSKQVAIDERMIANIFIMGQRIETEHIGFDKPLSSVAHIEHVLKFVSELKFCSGIVVKSNEGNFQPAFCHRDKEGSLRHKQCPMYLLKNAKGVICDLCKRSRQSLHKKLFRMKKTTELQRLRVKLDTLQQQKLDKMRQELKAARVGKARAVARLSMLKALREHEKKTIPVKSLEETLNEKSIPENERLVINEILAAGGEKDAKGRRYSKAWISLSLLLQECSPCAYRFLKEYNILPLPAVRTIRRFLRINCPNESISINETTDTTETAEIEMAVTNIA